MFYWIVGIVGVVVGVAAVILWNKNRACPGGCWWVEQDLCSACVGKEVRS